MNADASVGFVNEGGRFLSTDMPEPAATNRRSSHQQQWRNDDDRQGDGEPDQSDLARLIDAHGSSVDATAAHCEVYGEAVYVHRPLLARRGPPEVSRPENADVMRITAWVLAVGRA
ncbi:hypothetical protein GCM10009647_071040 [Streptomyces sanglieri]|uniref:Uncharacterized protein n=1 Tax=Streptomyces sanglieri TaxID=193460 RepID=A0ABW2WNB5_9ACTN